MNQVLTAQIIKRPWSRPGLKHCDISSTKYTERLISKSWTACEKCACNPFVPHGFAHTKLIISLDNEGSPINQNSKSRNGCLHSDECFLQHFESCFRRALLRFAQEPFNHLPPASWLHHEGPGHISVCSAKSFVTPNILSSGSRHSDHDQPTRDHPQPAWHDNKRVKIKICDCH